MLVPKLRFKREDGTDYPEWESKTLQEVTSHFQSGKAINRSNIAQTGKYAVYGGNGLRGFTDSYNHCGDYVLIGRQGALCGNVCFVSGKNYFTEHAIAVQANSENYLPFLLYQFDNMNLGQYSGQSAQAGLAVSRITQVTANFPHIEEQQKIADFLSTVDEVIAQSEAEVQNLEQQKKAAMQKIFSQEVRFKREDGTDYPEWEEDTIGNCVNVTSCKRVHQSDWTDSGVPFYRAREIVALYNNEPIMPLHISIEKYNALSKISGMISSGDLLVTGVGTIGVPYLVKESDKFYFKDGNIIWFQNEEKRALGSFLYYTLSTNEFQTKILQDSGKGTVHTFTIANAKETIIAIPCLEEQQKIADFLSAYDEAISYAKQELDKWKELKKGLLQQMFV